MSTVRQLGHGTDTGKKRRRNEDDYVVEPPLFAIADGMGGAQAGELASSLAAGAVREDEGTAGSGERRVTQLIQEANRRVYQRSSQDAAASGMGTTLTVALVGDGTVAFGHVGDSRAYLIRDRRLEQLTEDHSLVAELVRSGKLSPEETRTHPQRSVITRALGTDPDVDVDTFSIETQTGDLFMLCSDGLTSMVEDDVILSTIEENRDNLQKTAKALIRAANKGGGEDNITVVFFEIGDDVGEPLEETAQYPALTADGDGELDEDTLDELDRVPALDTMVVPPGEAQEIVAPKRRALARLIPALLLILVALAVVGVVLWTLYRR
ncbi:MAG: Stp1/IreP family PP2C-type Ser/Thr phosphatase [Actinobacteria bacterium]|nr:MAG: Stp1/IreP family PP2C-type Ser/Thr phosphatase [Actinomycetota bacterium]